MKAVMSPFPTLPWSTLKVPGPSRITFQIYSLVHENVLKSFDGRLMVLPLVMLEE